MGHEKLAHQLSEYATAAATPGKHVSRIKAVQDANAAAISAKTAVGSNGKPWVVMLLTCRGGDRLPKLQRSAMKTFGN